MKLATLSAIGVASLMLSACSGGDAPTTESLAPSATPTVIAGGETSQPAPSVGNEDDVLCAAVGQNLDDAQALEAKTAELTELMKDPAFLTDSDPTALNQWGEDLLALTSGTQTFYELGVSETAGDAINADFQTLNDFVQTYSSALATAAAEADSTMDFFSSMQELITDSAVRETLAAVPDAASNVGKYLAIRCKIAG